MAGLRQGLVLQWEKEFILQFHIYFYYSFAFISCARAHTRGGAHMHASSQMSGGPSSPQFSAACATAIACRNHSFYFYPKKKSYGSKVMFKQASYHCKRVPETCLC